MSPSDFWDPPILEREGDIITAVDFRDGYIQLEDGRAALYFDKLRGVALIPDRTSDFDDEWIVIGQDNQPTGQLWKGSLEVDEGNVIIDQAHNGLRRIYRTDGSVTTQYRMSEVTEVPGRRIIVYQNGTVVEEDLVERTSQVRYDDRIVERRADNSTVSTFTDGSNVEVETSSTGQVTRIQDQNGCRYLYWTADGRISEIRHV